MTFRALWLVGSLFTLVACGGGDDATGGSTSNDQTGSGDENDDQTSGMGGSNTNTNTNTNSTNANSSNSTSTSDENTDPPTGDFQVTIAGGDITVPSGQNQTLQAQLSGSVPGEPTFFWSVDGVDEQAGAGSVFNFIRNVGAATDFAVEVAVAAGAGLATDRVMVRVTEPGHGNQEPRVAIDQEDTTLELGGSTALFTATVSDPDGDVLFLDWQVDGSSRGSDATFVFDPNNYYEGDHTLSLVVTDPWDASSTDSITVTVAPFNTPPTASASFASSYIQGVSYEFDGRASMDPDGTIVSWSWDFDGDQMEDASGATVMHTFSASGSRSIRLTVTDDRGKTAFDSEFVEVNGTPTAALSLGTATVFAGVPVLFDASGSMAPDGNTLASFAFDFDDTDGVDFDAPDSLLSTPDDTTYWRYETPGTFTATVRVRTNFPVTEDTATLEVTVVDGFVSLGQPNVLSIGMRDVDFDSSGNPYIAYTFDANPEPSIRFTKSGVATFDVGTNSWSLVGMDADGIGSGSVSPRVVIDSNDTPWHKHQWSSFYIDLYRYTGSTWEREAREALDTGSTRPYDIVADEAGRVFFAYADEPTERLSIQYASNTSGGYLGGSAGQTLGDSSGADAGITGLEANDVAMAMDSVGMLYVAITTYDIDLAASHVSVYQFDTTGDLTADSWKVVGTEYLTTAFTSDSSFFIDLAAMGTDIYLLSSRFDTTTFNNNTDFVLLWNGTDWTVVGDESHGFAENDTQGYLTAAGSVLVYAMSDEDNVRWWRYSPDAPAMNRWSPMFDGASLNAPPRFSAGKETFYDAVNDRLYTFDASGLRYTTAHR